MASIETRLAALEAVHGLDPLIVFVRSFVGRTDEPIELVDVASGRAWLRLEVESAATFRRRASDEAAGAATARCIVLAERNGAEVASMVAKDDAASCCGGTP